MSKYAFIVNRTTTVFIVIEKAEDEADAEKQALALVGKYLAHDEDDDEGKKEDIAEAKSGLVLKQKKMVGRVTEYQNALTAEADESYDDEEEEAHETAIGELEEEEKED